MEEERMFEEKYYNNNTGHMIQVYAESNIDVTSNPMSLDTAFNFNIFRRGYESMQEHSYKGVDDWFDAQTSEGAYYLLKEQAGLEGKVLKYFVNMLCTTLDKVGIIAFPIRVYEQTDKITYYLGEWFDRRHGILVGFAWQTKENICKEYGCERITDELRQKLTSNVKQTLKDYSNYCNGYVYGYNLFDSNGEEIDGGSGFIADNEEELLGDIIQYLPSDITDNNFVEMSTEEMEKAVV
jgi:hypothetical protein